MFGGEALDRLLAGTGLSYRFASNGRTASIVLAQNAETINEVAFNTSTLAHRCRGGRPPHQNRRGNAQSYAGKGRMKI